MTIQTLPEAARPPGDRLLNQQQRREKCGNRSDMTLWRWERDGVIPKPIKIRGRNYQWESELDAALRKAAQ